MVTDRYQHLRHHADVSELAAWAAVDGLALVAVDNGPGAVPLETVALPAADAAAGRFVLALDGRPVALTAPHGGRIDWLPGASEIMAG
jgi:hypothetical protein